jgi:hypothetical protein
MNTSPLRRRGALPSPATQRVPGRHPLRGYPAQCAGRGGTVAAGRTPKHAVINRKPYGAVQRVMTTRPQTIERPGMCSTGRSTEDRGAGRPGEEREGTAAGARSGTATTTFVLVRRHETGARAAKPSSASCPSLPV